MYCLKGFIFATVIGIAMSYPFSIIPMSVCDATIVSNSYGTEITDCPSPFNAVSPDSSSDTIVTNPATLKGIKMNWFLNDARDPSLTITLEANATASAQEYTLSVLADYFTYPIYCGKISTTRPELSDPQTQTITLRISCLQNTLTPSKRVIAAVEVKGQNATQPQTETYKLPSCQDQGLMYFSNKCTDERNKIITINLEQRGNSVDALLQAQTAYRHGKTVYVMIAKRIEATFIPWKVIGRARLMNFPVRKTTFTDLEIGATYQVTVWRPDEPAIRYQNTITLKYDRKLRDSTSLMRRLMDGRKR